MVQCASRGRELPPGNAAGSLLWGDVLLGDPRKL